MKLLLTAVGKLKDASEKDICERYRKRFDVAGRSLGLGPLEITELVEARGNSAEARRNDEAGRALKICGSSTDCRVALDPAGKMLSSGEFAALLARRRDAGTKQIAFLIGGPDGHGSEVLSGADLALSLGPLTLPHGLARVVLLEQIYRAATILSGHPYHRA